MKKSITFPSDQELTELNLKNTSIKISFDEQRNLAVIKSVTVVNLSEHPEVETSEDDQDEPDNINFLNMKLQEAELRKQKATIKFFSTSKTNHFAQITYRINALKKDHS